MASDVAGVVLAAGAGTRLRPLTRARPKPLCPVGDRPLVDHAIDRLRAATAAVAVNVHHGRAQLEPHLAALGVHVSVEVGEALGTAGALGALRPWIDGRAVVVLNGDTWTDAPVAALLDGWDGERTRLLLAGADPGGPRPKLCGALLPWSEVADLAAEPSGLWELRWGRAEAEGRLERLAVPATFADCGTPAAYLAANLAWSGGATVVGEGATVLGAAVRSVVWPGEVVGAGEHLVDAIRYGAGRTVLVRP